MSSWFSISLPIKYLDNYIAYGYFSKGSSYGKFDVLVDGEKSADVDGYSGELEPGGKVMLGSLKATDPTKRITFKVTGKSESSSGYGVGLDAILLAPQRVFIQDWYVIGPFDNPKGAVDTTIGLGIVYGPERELDVTKVYTGKDGKSIQWKAHHTDSTGYVDFVRLYTPNQFTVGYGLSYVFAPDVREVPLFLGSDDGVKVWLNDRLAHEHWIKRGPNPDQDTLMIKLNKGWNKLLFKVEQGFGGWGFYCRVPNPRSDLQFSAEPKQGR